MVGSVDRNPSKRKLGEFSEFGMFALGMVAAPLAAFRGQSALAVGFWATAVALRWIGWARPGWLRPAFVGLSIAAFPIGWAVSNLVLVLLYYGVVTPIALVFRLIGRDALNRRLEPESATYWEPYDTDRDPERYLRTF